MVILFVTSRCNARCGTCFYHERLDTGGDLSLEELRRLAATLPPFRDLWLSGGEPLLRDDLLEAVAAFVEGCGVETVDLPVNGLFPERAAAFARAFHARLPRASLYVNVALDGLGETHDRIRGVPGNFARAADTLDALAALRPELARLRVHVNTVVCRDNLAEVEALARHVLARHRADGHFFQVIRGDAPRPELLEVSPAELARVHRFATAVRRVYARRLFAGRGRLDAWFRRATYVGTFLAHDAAQRAALAPGGGDWGFPCVAGTGALVVEHDGTVKACELRGPVGRLRDHGMDYRSLLAAGGLRREADDIAAHPCPCTHVCFIHTSLRRSPKALARVPLRGVLGR